VRIAKVGVGGSPAHHRLGPNHRLVHVRIGRTDAIPVREASRAGTFSTRAVLVMPVVLLVQVLSLVLRGGGVSACEDGRGEGYTT
jgi:hypothetical protein